MAGALTRWDPFAEIADLRSRFDRVFDELGSHVQGAWPRAIDVMRGATRSSSVRTFLGSHPTRSSSRSRTASSRCPASTRRTAATPIGGRYVHRERRFGSFSRSIALPAGVDAQAIKAQTHDGVVEVAVPPPSGATTQKVGITPAPASDED